MSQTKKQILDNLRNIIAGVYETLPEAVDVQESFLEMGLDSISIIQVRQLVKNAYGFEISVDRLFGDTDNLGKLADFIQERLPVEAGTGGVVKEQQLAAAAILALDAGVEGPAPARVEVRRVQAPVAVEEVIAGKPAPARERESAAMGGRTVEQLNQFQEIKNIINDQLQVMYRQMEIISKMGN